MNKERKNKNQASSRQQSPPENIAAAGALKRMKNLAERKEKIIASIIESKN